MRFLFALIACLFLSNAAFADEKPLPRRLIAIYDAKESDVRLSYIHRFLEMPANHLGYDIDYYDVGATLPTITDDVAGIVVWFSPGYSVEKIDAYLSWMEKAVAAKKKLIILENMGVGDKYRSNVDTMRRYNAILSHIGMQDFDQWNPITYRSKVLYMDNSIASFERPIGPIFPPYGLYQVIPGKAQSHLKVMPNNKPEDEPVDLIITGPNGGFVAEGYAIFHVVENEESRIIQWFVNPFIFLQQSLRGEKFPIPDTTTLNGKRIFYSHIDGDGWNNISELPNYASHKTIAAEVLRKEILEPYKDIPFSVGVIINDIEPDCYGVKTSEQVARDIYKLPNVEPSSHTHSHPLFWNYFSNYDSQKEVNILNRYPVKPKTKGSMIEDIKSMAGSENAWTQEQKTHDEAAKTPTLAVDGKIAVSKSAKGAGGDMYFKNQDYETPRSYACSPFNLDEEIKGSIERVNALSPAGKKAKLIQWSGDTSPFEDVLAKVREGGYVNINGGDSRFDNEYPSYTSVAPIGQKVGKERQIFSSNSNENTYTNLWTGRFFGFRYLQRTVENTESPMRVSPFNIYFHVYSAQKQASLHAVQENLNYALKQNIIPIETSQYAEIANGFYSIQLIPQGENSWKIRNRGALNTLRFDDARLKSVDFEHSEGVIGQSYFQGNLYIHLNPSAKEPLIKLIKLNKFEEVPNQNIPYLVESNWVIKDLQFVKYLLTIDASGFGSGQMQWKMPETGNYLVKIVSSRDNPEKISSTTIATDANGMLKIAIDSSKISPPVKVTIEPIK